MRIQENPINLIDPIYWVFWQVVYVLAILALLIPRIWFAIVDAFETATTPPRRIKLVEVTSDGDFDPPIRQLQPRNIPLAATSRFRRKTNRCKQQ
jgi:hypothetical protein